MYLSQIIIKNFRGAKSLTVNFNKDINVIIGPNGCNKSTIIDAIRLFYSLGNQRRDISISDEDFYIDKETGVQENEISIRYIFRDLTEKEKGGLYEYLVLEEKEWSAQATLEYTRIPNKYPRWSYYTGANAGQKADPGTFEMFQHYYLSALRDSTNDLLNTRYNILGKAIKRIIDKNNTCSNFEAIIKTANDSLLNQNEVTQTKTSINNHLDSIHKVSPKIGLQIEHSKIEYIVNVIKPFLPFSKPELNQGLSIRQNSLGFNNLIYIATVLSDMNDAACGQDITHYALLIEEPEAHLHPQLQLNLYKFLKKANCDKSCQLFITTHSPTLTSKVDLDNIIILNSNHSSIALKECFNNRLDERLKDNKKEMTADDFIQKKRMLERYLDVTRSQMFYASGILMIEGISEELLFSVFADLIDFRFEEKDIEIVQTGISFYPYLLAFNSTDEKKRIQSQIAICTDDDRFTDSKNSDYAFDKLIENNYAKLEELQDKISSGEKCSRINNIKSFCNELAHIKLCEGYKTLEYEIAKANISTTISLFEDNLLIKYLSALEVDKFVKINTYLTSLSEPFSEDSKNKIAILVWKSFPKKAEFAQDFAAYLTTHIDEAKTKFTVPQYIKDAFNHLQAG